MYAAVLALIGVIGAWLAWRRNPSYSARSTLRLLAVVALSVTALIGVLVAAVHYTANRSAPLVFTTLFAVIIVATLAMIFIIQSVSTPKAAKLTTALPASAKIVHVHREPVYRWAKYFAVLLAMCALLGLLIPGEAKYAVLSVAAITLLLAAILLPVMYVNARAFDRSLTGLEFEPWVHWQYSPDQWRQWCDEQVRRMQSPPIAFIFKRDWLKLAWPFVVIAAGVGLFGPGTWLERFLYVVFSCGAILILVVLGTRYAKGAPEKYRAKLLKAAPQAYLGHDGIFCDGVFSTWLGVSVYLVAASIDARPPRSLLFNFEKVEFNPYSTNQITPVRQSVLIPSGAEADIARLQRELAGRCPKAHISLT
jgi:hypothetical protein